MDLRHALLVMCTLAALVGCGGGDDGGSSGGGGGGGGSSLPNHSVSAADTSDNTARLLDLNSLRAQASGTALSDVTGHDALIIGSVRHAGWQAIDDISQPGANLDHGEPRSNTLFSDDDMGERIRKANGGTHLSPAYYFEDIASRAGTAAVTQLWNSVYHRIPMMRHRALRLGYGDMALARSDYPTAGVPLVDDWGNSPSGNGYATLNWQQLTSPAITLSYWPGSSTTGVPRTFASDTEAPDPVPGRNQVGCPIHVIFPETLGAFTAVNITLIRVSDNSHIPLRVLAGNGSPGGAAGDVGTLVGDSYLAPGELFAIPLPTPTNTGLAANADYTYNVSVTLNGSNYATGDVTYTTGP